MRDTARPARGEQTHVGAVRRDVVARRWKGEHGIENELGLPSGVGFVVTSHRPSVVAGGMECERPPLTFHPTCQERQLLL